MIDYTLDVRIVELCREAEKRRRWNRINWPAVAALATLLIIDGSLVLSIVLAWRHWR